VGDLMTYPNSLMLQKAVIKLSPLNSSINQPEVLEDKNKSQFGE
jgi:hypothetical protein